MNDIRAIYTKYFELFSDVPEYDYKSLKETIKHIEECCEFAKNYSDVLEPLELNEHLYRVYTSIAYCNLSKEDLEVVRMKMASLHMYSQPIDFDKQLEEKSRHKLVNLILKYERRKKR